MNNEKLKEIGNKLDVTDEELTQIRRETIKSKIYVRFTQIIIIIASIISGYLIGKNASPRDSSYPFFTSGFIMIASVSNIDSKYKRFLMIQTIVTIILSIVGFLIAFRIGQPVKVYGFASDYNVYFRGRINE